MKTQPVHNLNDALIIKIKSLYDVENVIIKALPKMAKAATDTDLKAAFNDHLKETELHVTRLEEIFTILGVKPAKVKVEAIRGLADDTEWIIKQKPSKEALDAQLIASASYVEHYEMAGYTAASNWARLLGQSEIADILQDTLQEEQAADDKMATLAATSIDERALEN